MLKLAAGSGSPDEVRRNPGLMNPLFPFLCRLLTPNIGSKGLITAEPPRPMT